MRLKRTDGHLGRVLIFTVGRRSFPFENATLHKAEKPNALKEIYSIPRLEILAVKPPKLQVNKIESSHKTQLTVDIGPNPTQQNTCSAFNSMTQVPLNIIQVG